MILTVLDINAYPGWHYVEFALRNLAAQTCRDFKTIILDMSFTENRARAAELITSLGLENVSHVPACEDRHAGRIVQWDIYNNAALLADTPWIIFYGAKRFIHRKVVESILVQCTIGRCTNMVQVRPAEDATLETVGNDFAAIETTYDLNAGVVPASYLAQTGFFSIPVDTYINTLNGYNECLLIQHWVDNDMNGRMYKLQQDTSVMQRGMLRMNSQLGYGAVNVGRKICYSSKTSKCINSALKRRSAENERLPDGVAERLVHEGFEWIYCPGCGTIAVDKEHDYMNYLIAKSSVRAPINIHGIGRNLSRVFSDVQGLSQEDKLDVIAESHTNPRYLEP